MNFKKKIDILKKANGKLSVSKGWGFGICNAYALCDDIYFGDEELCKVIDEARKRLKDKYKHREDAFDYYWKRNWYGYLIRRYILNRDLISILFFSKSWGQFFAIQKAFTYYMRLSSSLLS